MSTTEECIRTELAIDPDARILAVVPSAERRQAVLLAYGPEDDVHVTTPGEGRLLGRRYDVVLLEGRLLPEQQEWMDGAVMPRLAPTGYLVTGVRGA